MTIKYADVFNYCLSLPDVNQQIHADRGKAFSFNVQGRPFAWFETGAPIQWKFSLRVENDLYHTLLNPPKVCQADKPDGQWLMISRIETFDEPQVMELIDGSYQSALKGVRN